MISRFIPGVYHIITDFSMLVIPYYCVVEPDNQPTTIWVNSKPCIIAINQAFGLGLQVPNNWLDVSIVRGKCAGYDMKKMWSITPDKLSCINITLAFAMLNRVHKTHSPQALALTTWCCTNEQVRMNTRHVRMTVSSVKKRKRYAFLE